jgi:Zn finger protein HypA/HybF involved in hydrogenase expression
MRFICKSCLKSFDARDKRRKFCSSSCSSSFNNRGKNRHNTNITKLCRHCSAPFTTTIHKNKIYCKQCISNKIPSQNRRVVNLDNALTDSTRKKILIDIYGKKCSICLNDTWLNGPIPIEIDHVDGNSDNNSQNNLRLICPNCHATTMTYKGKNKGNGRYKRLQRFKNGLSY